MGLGEPFTAKPRKVISLSLRMKARMSPLSQGSESETLETTIGNGGRSSIPPLALKNQDTLKRAPYSKPSFTLSELKQAIPPHCFHRSVLRSLSYVVSDLTISYLLYQLAVSYIPHLPSPLHLLAWPTYWVLQGCILMGVWCLGHECGHHAFSEYEWLDDAVGFILHSSILVPYFSWKFSHRRHHSNTQSLERDELFVPFRKSDMLWYMKSFPRRLFSLAFTLLVGWPIYITFNASGRKYDRFTNHFDPYSPIFSDRERALVIISDIGFFGIVYILFRLATSRGLLWVTCVYLAPILVENILLIMVSYLHHTHPALPHYDSSEWDWLRGALSTVDRDYGILNKVFHGLTDTHVLHHLFSKIPHYHLMEATKAIKPMLGEYYSCDKTPIVKALWKVANECAYVEPDEGVPNKGVHWYNNKL